MVKYIFCILFGIFLIWGCNLVPDKELQEFRTEAGTTTIQSHNKSQSYRSKAVVKQSGKENNSFQEGKYDGKYDCNIADGILGNSLLSRTTSLSKILRFNVSSVTIRILSSLKYQFPKENGLVSLLHKSHQILLSILRLYTRTNTYLNISFPSMG